MLVQIVRRIWDLPGIYPKKSLRQLFQVTQKLIIDQTEITDISTIDWRQLMWRETTLLIGRAVQLAIAKTYVFSDSVLWCFGGNRTEPVKAWESKIKWVLETSSQRIGSDRRWTDGIRVANYRRIHNVGNSRRDSAFPRKDQLHVDVQWHWLVETKKQRRLYCELRTLTMILSVLKDSREDVGHF